MYEDGSIAVAVMSKGPAGFLLGRFGDEAAVETTIPNIMAEETVPEAPRRRVPMKRPASSACELPVLADAEAEEQGGALVVVPAQPAGGEGPGLLERFLYKTELYRKRSAVGVRRKNGDGRQIFSLVNRQWDYQRLVVLAQGLIHDMERGDITEDEAKERGRALAAGP